MDDYVSLKRETVEYLLSLNGEVIALMEFCHWCEDHGAVINPQLCYQMIPVLRRFDGMPED